MYKQLKKNQHILFLLVKAAERCFKHVEINHADSGFYEDEVRVVISIRIKGYLIEADAYDDCFEISNKKFAMNLLSSINKNLKESQEDTIELEGYKPSREEFSYEENPSELEQSLLLVKQVVENEIVPRLSKI